MSKEYLSAFSKETRKKAEETRKRFDEIKKQVEDEIKKQIRAELEMEIPGLSIKELDAAVENEFNALDF